MSLRIVLADDHELVRDGLKLLLEAQRDFTVVGAVADGRAVVQLAQHWARQPAAAQPKVFILDIAMPELNGIEATLQLLDLLPQAQVIILSMHTTPEYIFRALQAGAHGYLLKDSAGMELTVAVRTVAAGQRYLSQKISAALVEDYIRQRQTVSNPLELLSAREREVLQLAAEGHPSATIATRLKTVETYRSRAMQKLELTDLPSLVKFAIDHGLVAA